MDCYLINLDRSKDRFQWIRRQTRAAGIALRRVSAVDGKTLSAEEVGRWERVRHGRYGMGPGEFGCFLSHRRAWEMVIERKEPWAFIAEDDIHFSAAAKRFIAAADWIPADADIVKAETAKQRVWLSAAPIETAFGHRLHYLQSAHGGSAGYFVSRHAAQRLIAYTETFCSTLDQLLFNPQLGIAQRFRIYQIDPAICIQDWCLGSEHEQGLGSLLVAERQQFHGSASARCRTGAARAWYKITNPLKKAGKAGMMMAANALGTHTVKKIGFDLPACGLAASVTTGEKATAGEQPLRHAS